MRLSASAPPWVAVLIGFLWLTSALPYPFATIILDTARDLHAAVAIVDGGRWPLRGPVINAMVHLGPGWFYLLALPLALSGSIPATLLFVGALAGSKYLFAYLCGRRLHSTTFGVLWAIGLAFPGWSALNAQYVTHTSLVEAAVLGATWAALRVDARQRLGDWLLLGVMLALAFHAHPTTLVAAPILALWLMRRLRIDGLPALRGLLVCALPLAVALLPSAIAEWRDGWPALATLGAYAGRTGLPTSGLWDLLIGAHVGGARVLTDALVTPAWSTALQTLGLLVALIGGVGVLYGMSSPRRRLGVALLGSYGGAVLGVWLVREQTAFYMVLVLLPIAAAIWAWGIGSLYRTPLRPLAASAAAAAILLGTLQHGLLAWRADQGLVALAPDRIANVRVRDAPLRWHAALPALRLQQLGKTLCQPGTRVLHTELAALVEAALALPARMRCGATLDVRVGGGAERTDAQHLLGLTPAWLRLTGIAPDAGWSEARRLAPSRVIAAAGSETIPDGNRYPFRPFEPAQTLLDWSFSAAADATLLISHLHFAYDGAQTIEVRANGVPRLPLLETSTTSAWRCDGCTAPVVWEVRMKAHRDRVDLLLAEPFVADADDG